jgi:hypothetical protein
LEAFPDLAASIRKGRGPNKAPTKKLVSLRPSPDVIDYFKATGAGWQSRIDETLRKAVMHNRPDRFRASQDVRASSRLPGGARFCQHGAPSSRMIPRIKPEGTRFGQPPRTQAALQVRIMR